MIKRYYFINARCTEVDGYCYLSKVGAYSSFLSNVEQVYTLMTDSIKKELLEVRPNGKFEVVSFNKI